MCVTIATYLSMGNKNLPDSREGKCDVFSESFFRQLLEKLNGTSHTSAYRKDLPRISNEHLSNLKVSRKFKSRVRHYQIRYNSNTSQIGNRPERINISNDILKRQASKTFQSRVNRHDKMQFFNF